MRGIFITGTDTEVGKTIVTAGLLRFLRDQGIDAVSMKPVSTGAEPANGGLTSPDLTFHHDVAGIDSEREALEVMAPYLYEPACSPHLAGRMAGYYPDLEHIEGCAKTLLDQHDFLLVEGAGGVYAPINETETMLDMMRVLGYPVILVAHRGLGTINHSLLSIEALRSAGLDLMGIVFNENRNVPEDFIAKDNPRAVKQFGKVPVLGEVPYLDDLDTHPARAWETFEKCMPGLAEIQARIKSK
ncbi:MAG: dethiobiotin synthase [Candidatus Hydrogenedentes bacterium]|nr:dethiobiotin synthase [Candidatus Hydrogenedentota bacterium]